MTNKRYDIGDTVVNRINMKRGTLVDVQDTDDKTITENVKIKYESGETEWITATTVSQMLTETEPNSNKTFLSD
tara:strand:+ start:142 stop:363 length:222 start_codon:yes stop_codon:yes gene_type:complete